MRIVKKFLNSVYKRKNIFFGSGFSVEKSYGCKWLIDWSNSVDKKMSFRLFEDTQISFFIINFNKYKPEYFFDIGAHGGLYSIILKKNFPELKVLAFEPDQQNRYQLYGNLFLNNFENKVKVFDFGLSNVSKKVTFGVPKDGNRGSKNIQKNGGELICVQPLDKVFLKKNKICFLKIDVEGHEKNVVEGSINLLKNNYCFIQVEIFNESSFKEFDSFMKKIGYFLVSKINDYYYSNLNNQ